MIASVLVAAGVHPGHPEHGHWLPTAHPVAFMSLFAAALAIGLALAWTRERDR